METIYRGETNGLVDGKAYHAIDRSTVVDWTDARLARITRLRLLSDPGFPMWDVSYCHGELKDGTTCRVSLPFDQLKKRGMFGDLINYARKDGVYLKRLGVFDAISTLI